MSVGEEDIISQAKAWFNDGYAVALATVIRTNGSAPRQPGSHLAIREDGVFAGSVSAGCVENVVIETAQRAVANQQIHRLAIGPTPASASPMDVGLTCGGDIEILVEPFPGAAATAIQNAQAKGAPIVRALALKSGKERLLSPPWTADTLAQAAGTAVQRDACQIVNLEGIEWLLLPYLPRRELVIVGAVHIAQALAPLAVLSGYAVRIIDPRTAYAGSGRFHDVEMCDAWPDDAFAQRPLTHRSAIVTLSHDTKLDDAALDAALRSSAGYIGALGSSQSHSRRLIRLRAMGFDDADLGRIHGPVGLPIGARTPGEIAVAVMAELVRYRRLPRVAGIVLAAGVSRRMGFNKMAAPVRGKPLLCHAVEAALYGGLDPVIVVTGHEADLLKPLVQDYAITNVYNPDFLNGLGSSVAAGIRTVPHDCAGAMVLLGDMPGISASLVRQISAAIDHKEPGQIIAASVGGTEGHPVLWGRSYFKTLAKLDGDKGGKDLMHENLARLVKIPVQDNYPLDDIDTLTDLRRWQ